MTADAPQHPTHGIGTAVLMVNYRGGHATKPKRLQHVTITTGSADGDAMPTGGKGCRVTYSTITPAGRRMGVQQIRTLWCSA